MKPMRDVAMGNRVLGWLRDKGPSVLIGVVVAVVGGMLLHWLTNRDADVELRGECYPISYPKPLITESEQLRGWYRTVVSEARLKMIGRDTDIDPDRVLNALKGKAAEPTEEERRLADWTVSWIDTHAVNVRISLADDVPEGGLLEKEFPFLSKGANDWPRGMCRLTVSNNGSREAANLTLVVPGATVLSVDRQGKSEFRTATNRSDLGGLGISEVVALSVWTSSEPRASEIRFWHDGGSGEAYLKQSVGGLWDIFSATPFLIRLLIITLSVLGLLSLRDRVRWWRRMRKPLRAGSECEAPQHMPTVLETKDS